MTIDEMFQNALKAHQQGKLNEAEGLYREILRADSSLAVVRNNLGLVLGKSGRLEEAIVELRSAVESDSSSADFANNLGSALQRAGKFEEAAGCFERAIALRGDSAAAHNNLGVTLHKLGRTREALAALERAAELAPAAAEVRNNLGNVLLQIGRLDEAIEAYRAALRLEGNASQTLNNLGNALKDAGRIEEALACYTRAIEIDPGNVVADSARLYAMHFHPAFDAEKLLVEHRAWALRHVTGLAGEVVVHDRTVSAERRLRIGYVSAELRDHPVGRFMAPLLANHDPSQFEIYCYADVHRADGMTARLRGHVDHWRETVGLSDAALAKVIREDQIDILVDLTMHMAYGRLLAFARKPVPVQVTYLAYPSTTGVEAVDYRLTDEFIDPPEATKFYVEQSVRLPSYWCYEAPEDAPTIEKRSPARGMTFGCLNNFAKISPDTWNVWGKILLALPDSRLIVHAHEGSHQQKIRETLAAAGIAPEHVEFVAFLPTREYLATYGQIDIALDPFPYAGGTTTCDALWMGVPVVTLAGKTGVGRGGVSILSHLGLTEFITESEEDYARCAIELAGNRARLVEFRRTIRERMRGSVLMDGARFARSVELAYRGMWRKWLGCADTAGSGANESGLR